MAQRVTGWRAIFSVPAAYRLAQRAIGAPRVREAVVASLDVVAGQRVLDIGCGTGDVLDHLPAVDYVGYDLSPEYIESARRKYGDLGTFRVGRVGSDDQIENDVFDRALAKGVLHHLGDGDAAALFAEAAMALAPGGRLVTVDPCFVPAQSRLARFIISRDRGEAVRVPEAYGELARRSFDQVEVVVFDDLLRVPYTHAMVIATAPD